MQCKRKAICLAAVWLGMMFCPNLTTHMKAESPAAQTPGNSISASGTAEPRNTAQAPRTTLAPDAAEGPAATAAPREESDAVSQEKDQKDQIPQGINDVRVREGLDQQDRTAELLFRNAALQGAHYADFTFDGTQYVRGIFSVLSLYFKVPDYVTPTSAVFRVSYTASDLILSEYSSLTFHINSIPFSSTHVAVNAEQGRTVLYIPVPLELLTPGYNLLELSAYVRLTDDEGCTDDYNGANWIKFDETTCLRMAFELSDQAEEISTFPYPFVSITDRSGAQSAVAVSDAMAEEELTAALTLMADLGNELSPKNDLLFGRISETKRKNIVYFGLEENTSEHLLSLLDQPVPPAGAFISRARDQEHEYLLVIAKEQQALLEAARLLSDGNRTEQIRAAAATVSVGEAQPYMAAGGMSSLAVMGQYTLGEVLGRGVSFLGPFHRQTTISLPVPEDYTLSREGKFSFNIRYSENLDWDRSLLTVSWGDVPLYSRRLSNEGARGETVTFSVPADAVGQVGHTLTIAFDLEVKDMDCTPRQLDTPWAYVAEDSTLYLPQGEQAGLSLSNRPVPFQRNNRMNNVLFVLPQKPTALELLLAGRTAAMLGIGSEPYGTLNAVTDHAFDAAVHGESNLVVIGSAQSNRLIRESNAQLRFRYTEDMTRYASNDQMIFNDGYAGQVGVIQLLVSPHHSGSAMLVLSAPEESGLRALAEQISEEKKRWALSKEAVLVDPHGKVSSYQFGVPAQVESEAEKAPTFRRIIAENREPLILMLVGFGSVLLVLVGLLIVVIRTQRRKR